MPWLPALLSTQSSGTWIRQALYPKEAMPTTGPPS